MKAFLVDREVPTNNRPDDIVLGAHLSVVLVQRDPSLSALTTRSAASWRLRDGAIL